MAASLMTTAVLAADDGFRQRVRAAMVSAALSIAAEAVGGQDSSTYQMRHALAVAVLNDSAGYLDRFAWAAAANTTISGDVGPQVSIASSTAANPAVVTTAGAHGLSTGDWVEIAGHAVNTAANGIWPVTVIIATTFSIPVMGNGAGGASGTVARHPPDGDIQFTVNSDWNDIAGIGVNT